jgi:hypothetical protein
MTLEGEEPHNVRTVVKDSDSYEVAEFAHRDREFWGQEGIVEGGVRLLESPPSAHFMLSQLTREGKGDVHGLLLSALHYCPACGQTCTARVKDLV